MKIENIPGSIAKELLQELVDKLDQLDEDDFFGTEGWQKYLDFDY